MEGIKKVAQNLSGRYFDSPNLSNQNPAACPLCNDTGTEVTDKGARICQCRIERDRQRRIERKAELLARIPPLYAGVTLASLAPRPDLHRDQPRIIAKMQAAPFDNYYLCGNNDTGKTHLLWALYENAVAAGRRVAAGTLFDMLESTKAMFKFREFNDDRLKNLQTSEPFSAFIDDVDKARPTEYAAEFFFSYVDTLYRYKHQIVVTSQLDPEQRVNGRDSLIDHFEKADARYAVGIVRRLVNDQTHVVRLF